MSGVLKIWDEENGVWRRVPPGPRGFEGPQGIQGPQGNQGIKGDTGLQGAKGDQGDKGDKGDTGETGLQGIQGVVGSVGPAGMEWRGIWSDSVDYVENDAVSYNGASWFASENPPLGEVPDGDSPFWHVLSLRGEQGIQGVQGPQGIQGPQGVPGTGSINTVNGDSGPDVSLTATDVGAVGISGNETIAGIKSFSSSPVVPDGSFPISKVINLQNSLDGKSSTSHIHDDRYFTESEVTSLLGGKANTSHNHTKSQITDFAHTHPSTEVTGLGDAATKNTGTSAGTVAAGDHNHDDKYFTNDEADIALGNKADLVHEHDAFDITSGVLDDARLPTRLLQASLDSTYINANEQISESQVPTRLTQEVMDDAYLNSNETIPEFMLPQRLKAEGGPFAVDVNSGVATQAGTWNTNDTTLNLPDYGRVYCIGFTYVYPGADLSRQIMFDVNSDYQWTRRCFYGTWEPWVRTDLVAFDGRYVNVGEAITDAQLPARFGLFSKNIADWNLAIEPGFYTGGGGATLNAPTATTMSGIVTSSSVGRVIQTIQHVSVNAIDTQTWQRVLFNGVWTAWYKLQLSQTEQDARYALKAANVQRIVFTTAGTARPTGTTYVEWVGPVAPTNATDGDTWVNTA